MRIGSGAVCMTTSQHNRSVKEWCSKSPEETREIAASLARELVAGDVLALHGELGAGKTCFVQGLAAALRVADVVQSPTYPLINEYRGDTPLFHVDLYRVQDLSEAMMLGLDEYLQGNGITAIEWAERADGLLPEHTWHLYFEPGGTEDKRRIVARKGDMQ